MRVLHISTNYKPVRGDIGHGGVERLVGDLVGMQRTMGWEAAVVSFAGSDVPLLGPTFPHDIQIIKATDRVKYDRLCDDIFGRVADLIRHGDFDVVHDHMGAFAISPHAAALPDRTALVVSCYGQRDHPHYIEVYQALATLKTRIPAAVTTVCSEAHRAHFSSMFEADHVVHHACPPPPAIADEPLGYHLCMANIIPEKAQDMLCAVPPLTGVPIIFAGPLGEPTPEHVAFLETFTSAVSPLRLEGASSFVSTMRAAIAASNAIHVGEISDPVLRECLFRHASRLILVNRTCEPFSLVLVEALVRGLAVVAGPFASAREMGSVGVTLIEELSPGRVAEALATPVPDPHVIARAAQTRFTTDAWARRWGEVYDDARRLRKILRAP